MRPNEQRGRPVLGADGKYRVPTYDDKGNSTGWNELDPSRDARWNPGALQQRESEAKRTKAENELRSNFERREDRRDNQWTQSFEASQQNASRQHELGLQGLNAQLEQIRSTNKIALQQLANSSDAQRDNTQLGRETLAQNAAHQGNLLGLKGEEMKLNADLRNRELSNDEARWQAQIADAAGARKLQFIAQAASALLS